MTKQLFYWAKVGDIEKFLQAVYKFIARIAPAPQAVSDRP